MTSRDRTLTNSTRPKESYFLQTLLVFLLIDAVFISLFIARDFLLDANYNIGFLRSDFWEIDRDGGFPEIYQYLKATFAATLFGSLFVKQRRAAYLAWFLAFSYVLVDDLFQLHETFGNFLLANFNLPTVWNIESFLYVEPLLWGAVGLLLMSLITYAYVYDPKTRVLSRRLLYLFALLFLFAGLADAVHAYVDKYGSSLSYVKGITVTLEDGGEMLAMSVLVAYVFSYYHAATARSKSRPFFGP